MTDIDGRALHARALHALAQRVYLGVFFRLA